MKANDERLDLKKVAAVYKTVMALLGLTYALEEQLDSSPSNWASLRGEARIIILALECIIDKVQADFTAAVEQYAGREQALALSRQIVESGIACRACEQRMLEDARMLFDTLPDAQRPIWIAALLRQVEIRRSGKSL